MLTRNKKYERTNDMLGNTYGDLTVIGFYESRYTDKGKRLPQVLCECPKGHVTIKDAADMRNVCKNKCPLCSRESTKWRMDIDIEPGKEKFEIWKPIRGYEGYYEVSNFGRVQSLDREIISEKGIKHRVTGYILPQRYYENRYLVVFLSKDGKQKPYKVHHLVAEAFIPNPDRKTYINHKDGNKLNNWAGNLEWVTQKENIDHAFIIGCKKKKSKVTLIDNGVTFPTIKLASDFTGIDPYVILDEVRAHAKKKSKPSSGWVWAS